MKRALSKVREEARRIFLTGEMDTNAEIAAHLKVKPHTVGRWRQDEDWDGLQRKVDRRAGELFIEKIATDRVSLNLRHFKFWELVLAKLADTLKNEKQLSAGDMNRIAGILDRAQKGQRLAKGLSVSGETEESLRAQFQTEIRRLIDTFIDAVKENVSDAKTRDRIRRVLLNALPEEENDGTGDSGGTLYY